MTIQPEPVHSENACWDPASPAWISGLLYRNWINKLKKKIRTAKRNPYTSCFQEWTLCVCKTTNKKGKKKKQKKEKKKKEKLSISSENQRRLPHWLFPFVILIVLMTPKIPKISFSVRSAFCLCSFIILTLLSDVWHVWPQLRYPKEIVNLCDSGCWSGKGCFLCFSSCVRCPLHVFRMRVQDARSDVAVIGFLKFQIDEEAWLKVAFGPSHDLCPLLWSCHSWDFQW